MKMVVVGGNSRAIGKTSVVAGLIRALPHHKWSAIKLTQHDHGISSEEGGEGNIAPQAHTVSITEETERTGQTDTSRFLAAGAHRALWIRVRQGMLEAALPALQRAIAADEHIIFESNSILRFCQPNVYLAVLDPAKADFKDSAREFLARADACLVLEPGLAHAAWDGIPLDSLRDKVLFPVRPECYVTSEISAFVASRLAASEAAFVSIKW